MACKYQYNNQWYSKEELVNKLSQENSNFKTLYQNLVNEITNTETGRKVLDRIKRDYQYKEAKYDKIELFNDYGHVNTPANNFQTKEGVLRVDFETSEYNGYETNIAIPKLDGKEISEDEFVRIYNEYVDSTVSRYTLEEQQEEAIVELLGLMTAEKLDNVKDGKLISLLKRLLKEMKQFIRSLINQKEVEIDKLPDNMTLGDLSDLLAYSNSKLILPGYEVEYTTPDNKKFKTYQEASNHISELAKSVKDVDLDSVKINTETPEEQKRQIKQFTEELKDLRNQFNNFKFEKIPFNNKIDIYTEKGRLRQNYWARREDGTTGYLGGSKETLTGDDYDGFVLDRRGDPNAVQNREYIKISDDEAKKIFDEVNDTNTATRASIDIYNALARNIDVLENRLNALEEGSPLKNFISKNKEYEQSKEIIEEWKKVNNIQYNPEEIYSRGQEFSSVVGAYSSFDVNLMMQNLLQHIADNEKAGGKFAISAYTKPVDKQIGHLEGGGGKIKFKLYPQSQDILWASNIDVYSGSVWDASEKVNKDKKSELLGVSYTKYPSLNNIDSIQPNLASIVDNLAHHHNELGISLTGNNFRLEYDEDIPYTTKKIIDGINKILDQKYGKLVKPEIDAKIRQGFKVYFTDAYGNSAFSAPNFNTKEEAQDFIDEKKDTDISFKIVSNKGIQPTQTNETLKESIDSVRNKITKFENIEKYQKEYDDFSSKKENVLRFRPENYDSSFDNEYYVESLEQAKTKDWWVEDYFKVENVTEEFNSIRNKKAVKMKEDLDRYKKEYKDLTGKVYKSDYTIQSLINTKIASLKEVAKKYPRSLIRSEVKPISQARQPLSYFEDDIPFQKLPSLEQKISKNKC